MEQKVIKLKPGQSSILLQLIAEKNAIEKRQKDMISFISIGNDIDENKIKGIEVNGDNLILTVDE